MSHKETHGQMLGHAELPGVVENSILPGPALLPSWGFTNLFVAFNFHDYWVIFKVFAVWPSC